MYFLKSSKSYLCSVKSEEWETVEELEDEIPKKRVPIDFGHLTEI